MGVVLRTHPVRGESHIQCNANGEVATAAMHVIEQNASGCFSQANILTVDFKVSHLRPKCYSSVNTASERSRSLP